MFTKVMDYFRMKFMKPCPELETLKAIESVRAELATLVRNGYMEIGYVEYTTKLEETKAHLMSLYAALNVHNVIVAIEHIDYKEVA